MLLIFKKDNSQKNKTPSFPQHLCKAELRPFQALQSYCLAERLNSNAIYAQTPGMPLLKHHSLYKSEEIFKILHEILRVR